MSLFAFFLVFCSIFLHAAWHLISKAQKPFLAFFLAVSLGSLITTLPFVFISGIQLQALPAECFLFAALGGICGALCNAGLSLAYRNADVSLAYPMARAIPVLLTAIITMVSGLGTPLGMESVVGLPIVIAGCLMMPIQRFSEIRLSDYWNKGLLGIMIAALGTTGYTIFDSEGMKLIHEFGNVNNIYGACVYSFLREIFLFCALCAATFGLSGERVHFSWKLMRQYQGYVAGIIASIAYLFILIAMLNVKNVSYLQAFRQMSLPVGMIMGILFLHEKYYYPKILGVILIVAGLILLALL